MIRSSFPGSDAFESVGSSPSTGEYGGSPQSSSDMATGYVTQPTMTQPGLLREPLGIRDYGLEDDPYAFSFP